MNKLNYGRYGVLIIGVVIGIVIGAALFLGGRSVVTRVRATPRPIPAPKAGATVVPIPQVKPAVPAAGEANFAAFEKEVKSVANVLGISSYQWSLSSWPSSTTSDDVLKHYTDEMKKNGWSGVTPTYKNAEGHVVGTWREAGTASVLATIFVPSTSNSTVFVLAISGEALPEEIPTPE